MTIADWLMIGAVLIAPLVAVQVQRRLDAASERRLAKLRLFRTLMATRAATLSAEHVQALNMIDMEFYGSRFLGYSSRSRSEKAIVDAWKVYLDHLGTPVRDGWAERKDDLFTDLLHALSTNLGYDFDKVHLKRGIYAPVAHGQLEEQNRAIRDGFVQVLSGDRPLPVRIITEAATPPAEGNQAGQEGGPVR